MNNYVLIDILGQYNMRIMAYQDNCKQCKLCKIAEIKLQIHLFEVYSHSLNVLLHILYYYLCFKA